MSRILYTLREVSKDERTDETIAISEEIALLRVVVRQRMAKECVALDLDDKAKAQISDQLSQFSQNLGSAPSRCRGTFNHDQLESYWVFDAGILVE